MSSKRRAREEPCTICGHYHDYDGGEPCGVCGHVMTTHERKQQEAVIPTAIIPGFLYLGSYDTASRAELLKAMGITHILNIVPTCQALYRNTFTYHITATTPAPFEECFEFLEKVQQQDNGKVLVHCMTGINRSPTIVVGYLMKTRNWRLAESYKWVKDKRPSVNISPEETKRLVELEMAIHGSCSVPNGLNALDSSCGFFAAPSAAASSLQPGTTCPAAPATAAPVFGGSNSQAWTMSAPPAGAPVFGGGGNLNAAGGSSFVFGGTGTAPAFNNAEMEM